MMYCNNCGTELNEGTVFCTKCGKKVGEEQVKDNLKVKVKKAPMEEKIIQKAKLGISVGLLGAAVYFVALFGGYIPVILIVGYVLLFEESDWLKKNCVKAVVLLISIGLLMTIISLIPEMLSWVDNLVTIFHGDFNYSIVSSIFNLIRITISIIRTILFLILGVKAINQRTIAIPFVDRLLNKYL